MPINQLKRTNLYEVCSNSNVHRCTIRPQKTSQFKHYQLAAQELAGQYEWYFFCDDDDTYEPDRISIFLNVIDAQKHDPTFMGVYESSVGQTHQQYRYEYWAYCIRPALLECSLTILLRTILLIILLRMQF